ncbi:MAG: BatD family protein [Nitrospira sp.]|nr:protein BatD [Candidatus Manganitrophaceae bacterium]HIL34522.1 protein BatD [Candidatus Manganitrophaceae bacterium]
MVMHRHNLIGEAKYDSETKYAALVAFILILHLLSGLSSGWAATIHAELDRNRVSINESFTLVFETDGSVDGDPDFEPIKKHFEILQKSQGSTMEIINGQFAQRKRWTLTLMGREIGFFTIPPISFGKDKSLGLRIDIEKMKTSRDIKLEPLFLEVSIDPVVAYVQSQTIYTVRLYHSVTLLSGKLSEPKVSDTDVVIEKLGKDREFETTRRGRNYRVVERRYAIFPQQSGRIKIDPITFAGQMASRSRSNFNPFPGGGPIKRLRSKALELEVHPVPQNKVRGRWLPAKNLRIVEAWPEGKDGAALSKVGEPVTWTLTLIAEGLTAAQLPEISPGFPEGFKSYPDQPVLTDETTHEGLIGFRQERIALIPTKAGSFLLPAIEVPWWNTTTERMEKTRLPERLIKVAPADPGEQPGPSGLFEDEAEADVQLAERTASKESSGRSDFWSWISLVLALGWTVTLILWWGTRQRPSADPMPDSENPTLPGINQIKRKLKKACVQNQAHEAKETLLTWAQILRPPIRITSLGELGKQVGQALSEEISRLNGVLYSRTSAPWQDGPGLWAAFEEEISAKQPKSGRKTEVLAPMTPRP